MENPKIFAHGSYVGNTGYNQHTRDFFRELSKHFDIKVRNFTVGNSWKGYNENPHDEEKYFTDVDKKLLYQQILWQDNRQSRGDYPIYPDKSKEWQHDVNIVLCETNHYIFYDNYDGPKIAYNVWESTLQPEHFFNKLKEFDELWVPSKWQKDCTIAQGYNANKIKVVPEGVDTSVFFPNPKIKHKLTSDGRFKFFLAGRWDYRKSTKEIIETFLSTFDKNEPVDLIVSIDNPFSNDGLETTEQRLKHYGLEDERIKVLHFPNREDYVNLLKSSNCFVSCARSEGWNLPLIESMACGTPSIYSNCSGQLEFAEGKGIPVDILGERPASDSSYNHFNETVGNYYEPNFDSLSEKMRYVVEFYEEVKKNSLKESEQIRKDFSWERVAEIGKETILDFTKRNEEQISNFKENKNKVIVTYLDGPKVEIVGQQNKKYRVEFINKETSKVLYSSDIDNNMWTACSIRYYVPWQIKINGEIYEELSLKGKKVLISMESKSIGDSIAWVPYVLEFKKKHECEIYLSTFHNSFFSENKNYKDIKFINPGESVPCDALYRLGWFKKDNKWNDTDRNPNQVNIIPLQKTASDILGLEFEEINYGVHFVPKKNPKDKKYIVIVPNATAGCKEWIYEHWVELTKMIKGKGYDVISLTKYPHFIDGVENIFDEDLETVMNYMYHAEKFIGLGSGLSWLNWAMGKHTHMINGFARDGHEFTSNVTRIYNHNTCVFCWNDEVFVFDSGDWDWCPVYKNTSKQHICQKSILPSQVFEKLDL